MPKTSPSVVLTRKFSRCLSPMPSRQETMLKTAIDLTNQFLIVMKADEVKHKFSRPFLRRDHFIICLCRVNASTTESWSKPISSLWADTQSPLLPAIFVSHCLVAFTAAQSLRSVPLSTRQCSRFIITFSGSVLSIHSNEPRLLVIGTIPNVFKFRFLLQQAESNLKIPFTIWNSYWILWSSRKSSPPLIKRLKSFSFDPCTVMRFGRIKDGKIKIDFLTDAIFTFLFCIGSWSWLSY